MVFMNLSIFIVHICIILALLIVAAKKSKEWIFAFMAISTICANLFAFKQIDLFGMVVTCTDPLVIGIISSINILQEFFEKKDAKKGAFLAFFGFVFFIIMAEIHLLYNPSSYDTMQNIYANIITPMRRIAIASVTAFGFSLAFDYYFFKWISKKVKGAFGFRMFLSVALSQFLDTSLFAFIGLYGVVVSVMSIVVVSFFIKVLTLLFFTFGSMWMKKKSVTIK